MEMHQIRYFLAVGQTLNFTRAAERCNVSQPALTRAMQLLEEELGGPLFHRERNRTHLTELGRMMQPYLNEVFSQSTKAKEQAQAFIRLDRATLTIGVIAPSAPQSFSTCLADTSSRTQVWMGSSGMRSRES